MSWDVIGAAMAVQNAMGPGSLERLYHACMIEELRARGYRVESEVEVPAVYRGRTIAPAFKADLVVDDRVLVEVKTVENLLPVHRAQLVSYVNLAKKPVGLLLNFHCVPLKEGIVRVVGPAYDEHRQEKADGACREKAESDSPPTGDGGP